MAIKIGDKNDLIFDTINYTLLTIILLIIVLPLVHVVSASISNPKEVMAGNVYLYPKDFSLEAYKGVFKHKDIMTGYRNTIFYTLLGTAINVVMTICGAYPLSKKDFLGKNIFTAIFAFTMFFSGGLIPTYLIIQDLGLVNTIWALLLPGAVSMYNMVIMRTFFQTNIPIELHESALLDGCSNIKILLKIVLPLSKAILAVITLFYVVGHWNSYFSALIYITDRNKYPLQLFLREVLVINRMNEMITTMDESAMIAKVTLGEGIKYAVIIVANLPVLMFYPFLQKYFVQGIMIGAIKG